MKKLFIVTFLVSLCASQANAFGMTSFQASNKQQMQQELDDMKKKQRDVRKYMNEGKLGMAQQALHEMQIYKNRINRYEGQMKATKGITPVRYKGTSGLQRAHTTVLK